MSDFQTVARAGDIPEGEGRAFLVGDKIVAVFNEGGVYRAIDDTCPHMGASLACGQLYEGTVICGWHMWRFRLEDGAWLDNPRLKVNTYNVRVVDGEIQVRLRGSASTKG